LIPNNRYKVAHQDKTGTVVGDAYIGDRPGGFEGEWWPENGRVVIVAWRKKLTVEPRDRLAKLDED
jgi:hypothetical protein